MEYKREPVKGYEEYQVDTNGVVYSKKGKPLKWSINPRGYGMIKFSINGQVKGFGVHTIVARQFIPGETEERNQVNHIDGNKLNNNVDNLEWVTPLENMRHAIDVLGYDYRIYGAVGGERTREHARRVIGENGDDVINVGNITKTSEYIADKLNLNLKSVKSSIYRVICGERKTYLGYIWKYA